jgi:hypothetical protein
MAVRSSSSIETSINDGVQTTSTPLRRPLRAIATTLIAWLVAPAPIDELGHAAIAPRLR